MKKIAIVLLLTFSYAIAYEEGGIFFGIDVGMSHKEVRIAGFGDNGNGIQIGILGGYKVSGKNLGGRVYLSLDYGKANLSANEGENTHYRESVNFLWGADILWNFLNTHHTSTGLFVGINVGLGYEYYELNANNINGLNNFKFEDDTINYLIGLSGGLRTTLKERSTIELWGKYLGSIEIMPDFDIFSPKVTHTQPYSFGLRYLFNF